MTITKRSIEERLEALKRDLQSLSNQITDAQQRSFAVQGAILDCEYWLQQVDKEDGKSETNS
jgi:hypothetical protein